MVAVEKSHFTSLWSSAVSSTQYVAEHCRLGYIWSSIIIKKIMPKLELIEKKELVGWLVGFTEYQPFWVIQRRINLSW